MCLLVALFLFDIHLCLVFFPHSDMMSMYSNTGFVLLVVFSPFSYRLLCQCVPAENVEDFEQKESFQEVLQQMFFSKEVSSFSCR